MRTFAFVALLAVTLTPIASAAPSDGRPPDVELWRLECGTFPDFPMDILSDDDRYRAQRRNLSNGCYLIRHGSDYLLWDAGLPITANETSRPSVISQLAEIGVPPEKVRYLAISHLHLDHIGQAGAFSQSTLLIGAKEWATTKSPWVNVAPLRSWASGSSKVELVSQDPTPSYGKDVFGDGSVRMISTPGHTPGHHALMVQLKDTGAVMLSGDLFHVRESFDHDAVPAHNHSRAETLASIARFKSLASRYNATVIVQHDVGDVSRLPPFPQSAR